MKVLLLAPLLFTVVSAESAVLEMCLVAAEQAYHDTTLALERVHGKKIQEKLKARERGYDSALSTKQKQLSSCRKHDIDCERRVKMDYRQDIAELHQATRTLYIERDLQLRLARAEQRYEFQQLLCHKEAVKEYDRRLAQVQVRCASSTLRGSETRSMEGEDCLERQLNEPDWERWLADKADDTSFCTPENVAVSFGGIASALSYQQSTLQVSWEAALVVPANATNGTTTAADFDIGVCGQYFDYHVFVAGDPGYDFSETSLLDLWMDTDLTAFTVSSRNVVNADDDEDEIGTGKKTSKKDTKGSSKEDKTGKKGKEEDEKEDTVVDALSLTISGNLTAGQTYAILVVAQAVWDDDTAILDNAVASDSRISSLVTIASADPILQGNVARVVSWSDPEDEAVTVERLDETTFRFLKESAVTAEVVEDLMAGDFISALDVESVPFLIQLVGLVSSDAAQSTWDVAPKSIVDLYARLDLTAAVDTTDFYSDVAVAVEDEGENGRQRRDIADLFTVDINLDKTNIFPISFTVGAELGLAKLSYTLDFKETTQVKVDIEADLFGVDRVDLSLTVERSFVNKVALEFAKGVESKNEPKPKVIWSGTPKPVAIVVGGVPVHLLFTPALLAKYKSFAELKGVFKGEVQYTQSSKTVVSFDLANGWKEQDLSPAPKWGYGATLGARAALQASATLRFQMGILVYGSAFIAIFAGAGPFIALEAMSIPAGLVGKTVEPFYFTKCDLGALLEGGVEAEFVVDIPFVDEDKFKLSAVLSTPFNLVTLPSATVNAKSLQQCVGEDAIQIEVEATQDPYGAPIDNNIRAPAEFIPAFFRGGVIPNSDWTVAPDGDRKATLSLKRSVISERDFYEKPSGTLYYQTRADIINVPLFTLLFSLGTSGLPAVDAFDCCEDSDCDLKFNDGISRTCENNKCDGGCSTNSDCKLGEQCCDEVCISEDECCDADPCCESEDPCCGSEDPCCGSEDPCCGSTNPCCDSTDPCCGTADPTCCVGSPDPCCGSTDTCCRSADPCCGKKDGCCGSGNCGGSSGDPHITTFDGLYYDCQGQGDFVLVKSGEMQVQGRYQAASSRRVSLTVGVAVRESLNSTLVELAYPLDDVGEDPVLRINGTLVGNGTLNFEYEDDDVLVIDEGSVRITFKSTALTVYASFGKFLGIRYMNVRVAVPDVFGAVGTLGLLGSADDNAFNDWTTGNGTVLAFDRRNELTYCLENWCITDPAESLFFYDSTAGFDSFSGCLEEGEEPLDLSLASPELVALCGTNTACLTDGLEFGLGAAQLELLEQAVIASAPSRFRFEPASFKVNETFDILVTVDLSGTGIPTGAIDGYAIYRVNPENGSQEATPTLTLYDDGIGADTTASDLIFSNTFSVVSNVAGTVYSFRAIPLIGGPEDPDSAFVLTRLSALRSFSELSGIGELEGCNPACEEDEDPCTIAACGPENVCVFNPVACEAGKVCDSFTGRCEEIQNLVPCVAVIDEWDNAIYNTQWESFREEYPQRPFCLLVPNSFIQSRPTAFEDDSLSPDGIDRTISQLVSRDNGNQALASSWFDACNLGSLSPNSLAFVGLFVDTSGSMTLNTVRASYDMFLADVANASLAIAQVFNNNERWIDPFLTTLVPQE